VATEINVSQERVRQLEDRALLRLRRLAEADGISPRNEGKCIMMIRSKVLVGQHAGKRVLTGMFSFDTPISWLKSGTMGINPEAQRSLAKGADKDTTAELLDGDRAHTTRG